MIEKKLMITTLLILSVVFSNCNQAIKEKRSSRRVQLKENKLIKEIDSLHLHCEYNKAKWWIYCFHCDDTCRFWPQTGIKDSMTTLGELELQLNNLKIDNDTIMMFFNFYYKDTLRYDSQTGKFANLTGVKMMLKNDTIISLFDDGNIKDYWDGPHSRFAYPLQPEVIKYIRENKNKIDPWFYQEAKKRGVFDSSIFQKNK